MIPLSSTQNCCCYKLGKFACHPPSHLDGLNFSYSFSPSKITVSPKLLRSLSRSMTPRESAGGIGRQKKAFQSLHWDLTDFWNMLGANSIFQTARYISHLAFLVGTESNTGDTDSMQASYSELQTVSFLHVCP